MIDRRAVLASGLAFAAAQGANQVAHAETAGRSFPEGFIWGAATAGHQIEGNNVNSDFWALEHTKPTIFSEPSLDACNSLDMWPTDLDLAAGMGLNAYRFSIEWSRIEPAMGNFSVAMLDHYKRIIAGCRARGLTPLVTFSHWTVPVWFAARGGWTAPDSPDLFARYCARAMLHFGQEIGLAFTFNEPNGLLIARRLVPPGLIAAQGAMLEAASRNHGVTNFVGGPAFGQILDMLPNMIAAHASAKAAIKAARSDLKVGATLAISDEVAVGKPGMRDAMRKEFYGAWLDAVRGDDFVGVQNYHRNSWGEAGLLPPPAGALLSDEGMEVHPASLAGAVRYVHQQTGRPVLVTEHGYYTGDDRLRVAQLPLALGELHRAITDGVPVLGYVHWTLIDNFEWTSGYRPKLGLHAVDRTTLARTPKPSAAVLGAIARSNRL